MEKREEELNPGKEIEDRKQISFTDQEARIMGKKSNYEYCYNGQISVDKDNQIIIGEHLSQNANDKQEVNTALIEIKETTGKLPDKMSLDNGYMSGSNLESFEGKEIDVYIATGRGEKSDTRSIDKTKRQIKKSDFIYDESADCFVCPAGYNLELKRTCKDGKKIYQAEKGECDECRYKSQCCNSKKGLARTINTDDKEPLRQKMNKKMEEESSKEVYKKRKEIVEPVFGHIKNKGFRGFSLRGYEKVKGEFSLVCAVHNIKKIVKAIIKGEVCPAALRKGYDMT